MALWGNKDNKHSGGTVTASEREPLHGYRRLTR